MWQRYRTLRKGLEEGREGLAVMKTQYHLKVISYLEMACADPLTIGAPPPIPDEYKLSPLQKPIYKEETTMEKLEERLSNISIQDMELAAQTWMNALAN